MHKKQQKNIFAGVPQGSILETLQCILRTYVSVNHYVYADDTASVISREDLLAVNILLQIDFPLQQCSSDVGLIIN